MSQNYSHHQHHDPPFPGRGEVRDSRIEAICTKARLLMQHVDGNPNLTPEEKYARRLSIWNRCESKINEIANEQVMAMVSGISYAMQDLNIDGSAVAAAIPHETSPLSYSAPSQQPSNNNQFPPAGSADHIQDARAAFLTNSNFNTAAEPSSSSATDPTYTRKNSCSVLRQQTAPYSLDTTRHHHRHFSQPNTEQNRVRPTTSHRKAKSTSEIRYNCRTGNCSAHFSRARDEKRHYKSVHQSDNFTCKLCWKVFTRFDSMKRHWENSCSVIHGEKRNT